MEKQSRINIPTKKRIIYIYSYFPSPLFLFSYSIPFLLKIANQWDLADHVLCLDSFKLGILAQNSQCPGFATLIHLLTTSIPDASRRAFLKSHSVPRYMKDYINGSMMEIYPVVLSHSSFIGHEFGKISQRIYELYGCLLFGLGFEEEEVMDDIEGQESPLHDDASPSSPSMGGFSNSTGNTNGMKRLHIFLNPIHYRMMGGEIGYIVATNMEIANEVGQEGVFYGYGDNEMENEKDDDNNTNNHGISNHINDLRENVNEKVPLLSNSTTESLGSKRNIRTSIDTSFLNINNTNSTKEKMKIFGGLSLKDKIPSLSSISSLPHHISPEMMEDTPSLESFDEDSKLNEDLVFMGRKKPLSRPSSNANSNEQLNLVSSTSTSTSNPYLPQSPPQPQPLPPPPAPPLPGEMVYHEFGSAIPLFIRGHLIVCDYSDSGPPNLESFVAVIRSQGRNSQAIVVLSQAIGSWWRSLEKYGEVKNISIFMFLLLFLFFSFLFLLLIWLKFDIKTFFVLFKIYWVQGSPLSRKDLKKAGIKRATKAVILANPSSDK